MLTAIASAVAARKMCELPWPTNTTGENEIPDMGGGFAVEHAQRLLLAGVTLSPLDDHAGDYQHHPPVWLWSR